VGQRIAGGEAPGGLGLETEVGREHVARRQPEHRPQQRQRTRDAAGRLQRAAEVAALVRVRNR
jgi:hypothetical protein